MIPMEYVQKIKESASFQEGLATMSVEFWIRYGWHGQDPTAITDVKALKPNNLQPQNYTLK
jgi:peptidyl-dipeptidase Dcp